MNNRKNVYTMERKKANYTKWMPRPSRVGIRSTKTKGILDKCNIYKIVSKRYNMRLIQK